MKNLKMFNIVLLIITLIIGVGIGYGYTSYKYDLKFVDEFFQDKANIDCVNCHLVDNKHEQAKLEKIRTKLANVKEYKIDERTSVFMAKENLKYIDLGKVFAQYVSQYYSDEIRMRQKHTIKLELDISLMLRQLSPKYGIKNYIYQYVHTDTGDYLLFEFLNFDNEKFYMFSHITTVTDMIKAD